MTRSQARRWGIALIVSLALMVLVAGPIASSTPQSQSRTMPQPVAQGVDEPAAGSGSVVTTYSSTPLNASILDNGTVGGGTINIVSSAANVVDVNVRVRVTHLNISDVDMYLVGPDGTTVQLATDVGGTGNDFGSGANCTGTFTTFDDEATTLIEAGTAPFGGLFRPEGALSALDGKPIQGSWTLRVTDDTANAIGGTLICFELIIRRTGNSRTFSPTQDGRPELSVWRPSNTTLYVRNLSEPLGMQSVGQAGDIPVPADYSGEGIQESYALFRPSTGQWLNAPSVSTPIVFGINGDVPVPGDYNADGTSDIAVWRPSDSIWYLRNLGNFAWGVAGDIPVPHDYNGDGQTDIAVWRPSEGTWYIRNVATVQWGAAGDIPVPADYNGDGRAEIAVFRPSNGYWFIVTLDGQHTTAIPWGGPGDIPIPADYDADGKADLAVFRGGDGGWYLRNIATISWGTTGDIPLLKRPTYPGYPY